MATRIVRGVRFIRQDDGSWEDEDGRYVIAYDDTFESECDDEHPMKISKSMRERFYADTQWEQDHSWPFYIRDAIRNGRRGYLCPGCEPHNYGLWVAGEKGNVDEVISRDEKLTDAMYHIAKFIETGRMYGFA